MLCSDAGAVGWAKLASGGGSSCLSGCLGSPLLGDLGMLCCHKRVQPACEQSLRAGHAYTATLDQQGSGGLGLRPSLVVGDALPFNNLPIDNGSGAVQRCSRHRSS